MSAQSRFLLVALPPMDSRCASDRAIAVDAALRRVAFDYLESLATSRPVNLEALEQTRLSYVERHRRWLEM